MFMLQEQLNSYESGSCISTVILLLEVSAVEVIPFLVAEAIAIIVAAIAVAILIIV